MNSCSRWLICAVAAIATIAMPTHAQTASAKSLSAADAIRVAVVQRLGASVDVVVSNAGVSGDAKVFREARPDPMARLGESMRFTLITDQGAALPVTVAMRVSGTRVVTKRAVARGEIVTGDDVESIAGEIAGVPMRRLPTASDVTGAKALRPLSVGETVLESFVATRRVIERGDDVTVVAAAGAIEVTAAMVASDGGQLGDVIRVMNPDTKRFLRARIVKAGVVEVIDGR
jgi:flagella basal body P-ring formation protein FlgA